MARIRPVDGRFAAAALGYVAAVLTATWPTCLRMREALLGTGDGDLFLGTWGLWWYHRALDLGVAPTRGDLLAYPFGGAVFVADPLNSVLSLPLQALVPLPVAYDLLIMGHLVFAALATFSLLRWLGAAGWPAFAGGMAYGFSALLLGYVHNGVSQQVSAGWLPLFALRFLMAMRPEAGLKAQAVASACLTLGVVSSWYNAACLILSVPFLLWPYLGGHGGREALRRAVRVSLAAAILSTPYLLVQLAVLSDPDTLEARGGLPLQAVMRTQDGSDLTRFAVPRGAAMMRQGYIHSPYLGLLALALAMWGTVMLRRRSQVRALAAMLGFFVLLACGFFLEVNGRFLTVGGYLVPMPFLFLHRFLPGFAWLDFPHRFVLPGLMALACLAGLGLDDLCRRIRVPTALLCLNVAVALFAETVLLSGMPYPMTTVPSRVPGFYARAGASPDMFGIVDLPTVVRSPTPVAKAYFYYQTVHGKGIPYDISATVNARLPGAFARNEGLRRLAEMDATPGFSRRGISPEAVVRDLRALGYRYVVVHVDVTAEADVMELRWLLDSVLPPPLAEDGLLVYDLGGRP